MSLRAERRGWCEIRIEGPTYILEAAADFLTTIGSGGAIFSEGSKPRPGHERLTGFLPNDLKLSEKLSSLNRYLKELRAVFPGQELSGPKIQTIVDRDWINQWRETVVPFKVSKKFWVVPEWSKRPAQARKQGELVILMEPGLAFGTGFHSTTQLSMEFIEELVPEKAKTVLDLGTGTGILAMAAAMLGAAKVVAADIDPMSLKTAEENIKMNKLLGKIELVLGGSSAHRRLSRSRFELVIANIFANELKRLRDYIARHLKKRGYVATSGILPDQVKDLIRYYNRGGFKLAEKREKQGWAAVLMIKR